MRAKTTVKTMPKLRSEETCTASLLSRFSIDDLALLKVSIVPFVYPSELRRRPNSGPTTGPALRRIAAPLLLIAASVLVFFIGLEVALRLISYPRTEAKILCLDAIVGNVYCPNLNERLDNMYESTLQVSTNSQGMADREYALAKPAGT